MAAAKQETNISVKANIFIFIRTGQRLLIIEGAKNVTKGFSLLPSAEGALNRQLCLSAILMQQRLRSFILSRV